MSAQLHLVSPAEAARDEAIERVGISNADWVAIAVAAVRRIGQLRGPGSTFTSDAIWFLLEHANVPSPTEPRALGAAMQAARRAGICEATDMTVKSVRVENHARPLRVWRIL